MKKESVEENPGAGIIQIVLWSCLYLYLYGNDLQNQKPPSHFLVPHVTLVGGMELKHVIKTSRNFLVQSQHPPTQ